MVNRKGGVVLFAVGVLSMCTFVAAFAIEQFRSSVERDVSRALAGIELEQFALEALEEAHHWFALGREPLGSRSAARRSLDGLTLGRGIAPGADRATAGSTQPALTHDQNRFLATSSDRLLMATPVIASAAFARAAERLEPVEIRVVNRRTGPQIRSPNADADQPLATQRQKLGLPAGLSAFRRTWGTLELTCRIKCARTGAVRRATRRKLFTLVEYTPLGGTAKSYAYIFPQAFAQAMERE